jgi:hypothetical protein
MFKRCFANARGDKIKGNSPNSIDKKITEPELVNPWAENIEIKTTHESRRCRLDLISSIFTIQMEFLVETPKMDSRLRKHNQVTYG